MIALDVTERVSTALACIALDRQLSGVILLDLDPVLLSPLATWLAELIGGSLATDHPPVLDLGVRHTEEALWGRYMLTTDRADPLHWLPGTLDGHKRGPGIVIVPDLSRLSLPAARAAVTLVGADVAHLESSHDSAIWHPRDRWLATLDRQEVGTVSPHLLDRFSVRVDAAGLEGQLRSQQTLAPPVSRWKEAVRLRRFPTFSAEAAERVEALVATGAPGLRRDLALARMARALAGLEGETGTLARHVDRAATLIGIWPVGAGTSTGPGTPAAGLDARSMPPGPAAELPAPTPDPPTISNLHEYPVGPPGPANGNGHLKVAPGDEAEQLPLTPVSGTPGPGGSQRTEPPVPGTPYPEDGAIPRRVADPLHLGWRWGKSGPARGYPIGTQQARDLNDLAVVPTLIEALLHQAQQCPEHYQQVHPLHLRVEDLRSYRRAPWTGHLLVLVLDHTCRVLDWDWLAPLAPYLSWAYITRAQVGVIQVGAAVPEDDPVRQLRASEFRVRNLLDPRVEQALEPNPGRATPLAHGLTLAAAILRHDTQQGGAPVTEARLVVVTDGRANVPLSNSQSGTRPTRVGQQGIDDAENAARAIRGLHRVQSVVIDPGSLANGHLATRLAAILDAPIKHASPSGTRGMRGAT